jgi:hypothetical protein
MSPQQVVNAENGAVHRIFHARCEPDAVKLFPSVRGATACLTPMFGRGWLLGPMRDFVWNKVCSA